jgi:hypothetical protein
VRLSARPSFVVTSQHNLDAILHQFLSCHCDGPLHNPLILRNRLPTHGLDLFGSFVNGRRSLVLGDVERSYDFLLSFRGCGDLFFVLKWLIELIRQIDNLSAGLCEVRLAFAQSIFNAVERVF